MCVIPILSSLEFSGVRVLGVWEKEDRKVEEVKLKTLYS